MSWTISNSHFNFIFPVFHEKKSDIHMSRVSSAWVSPNILHDNFTFIVLKKTLSFILYPYSFRNIINHRLYRMYSFIPNSSVSVEILTLIFFFNDLLWMIPYSLDMAPPVWLLMSQYISYNVSIQVNTRSNLFLRLRAFLQLYSLPKLNLS